jgi:hypothetical protein
MLAGAFVMSEAGGMAVQAAWGSDWVGQGGAVFPDLEAARAVMRGRLRASLRWVDPSWRGCLMRSAGAELLARVATEGRDALAEGKPWRGRIGPMWVTLAPWEESGPLGPSSGCNGSQGPERAR